MSDPAQNARPATAKRPSILHSISELFRENNATVREEPSPTQPHRRHRNIVRFLPSFRFRGQQTLHPQVHFSQPRVSEQLGTQTLQSSDLPPPYSPRAHAHNTPIIRPYDIDASPTSRLTSSPSAFSLRIYPPANVSPSTSFASMQVQPVSEIGTDENRRQRGRHFSSAGAGPRYSDPLSGFYTPSTLSLDEISLRARQSSEDDAIVAPRPRYPSFSDIHDESRGLMRTLYYLRRGEGGRVLDGSSTGVADSDLALAWELQDRFDAEHEDGSPVSPAEDPVTSPAEGEATKLQNPFDDNGPAPLPIPVAKPLQSQTTFDGPSSLPPPPIPPLNFGLVRQCIVCQASPSIFLFPTRPPSGNCLHSSDVCTRCLKKGALQDVQLGGWDSVVCPQCEKLLAREDVLRAVLGGGRRSE